MHIIVHLEQCLLLVVGNPLQNKDQLSDCDILWEDNIQTLARPPLQDRAEKFSIQLITQCLSSCCSLIALKFCTALEK